MRPPSKSAARLTSERFRSVEEITFYSEWLPLPKEQFRLLAMIAANGGEFVGNYTDICNYLSVTPQSRNKTRIKLSIEALINGEYITCRNNGRTQHLKVIPKAKENILPLKLAQSIINHDYSKEAQVAWEQVLKLYIWILQNNLDIVTNKVIAAALSTSESTVCSAKNVLVNEYETITKKRISDKLGENWFRTLGQELRACAWWKDISKQ